MKLAIICLPLFVLYVIASAGTSCDTVVNVTNAINASFDSIRTALKSNYFDPMELMDADETQFKGIAIIKDGKLTGAAKVKLCGKWYLTFSDEDDGGVRSGGHVCANEIRGKFSYRDRANSQFGECVLDVIMRDASADIDVLYNRKKNTLTDPRINVTSIGDTQMFLDKCAPNFPRIRLSKKLESIYQEIIVQQAVITSVKLGEKADEVMSVVNFYNNFVAKIREKMTKKDE